MDELIAWLLAQLDEDERVARRAEGDPVFDGTGIVKGDKRHPAQVLLSHVAAHISRHDPAHVLADIEAKRAVIEEVIRPHLGADTTAARVAAQALRLLASAYRDHPGYRAEWAPG